MRASTPCAGPAPFVGEIAEPALFPEENPNPVFRVTPDGRVVYANRASAALLAAWGVTQDGCAPPPWRERLASVIAVNEPRTWDAECDGRMLQLNCVPIAVAGYVNVYASDVTERVALLAELTGEQRRTAELAEALRRERDLQQTLLEHANACLVYLDRDFNFVRMNAAYEVVCQRPRSEMLGRNHFELFPNAENEAIFCRVRDTGQPAAYMAKPFEFADQPWRGVTYWDWTLTPVKTPAGEVEGLVFSLVEVTERVLAARLSDALNEIHAAVASQTDLTAILRTAMERSAAALGCATAAIGMRENGCWVLRHGVGFAAQNVGLTFTDEQAKLSVQVAKTRQPAGVRDEPTVSVTRKIMADYGVRGVLALPLVVRDDVIGVLTFNFSRPRGAFTRAEMDFAAKLATAVSLTLENARVLELQAEQRRAAEAHAAELEATLEAISDGVVIYTPDRKIVRHNAAATRMLRLGTSDLDLSFEERRVRLAAELVRDPTAGAEQMPAARALRGENVRGELMRLRHADHPAAERLYVLASAAPIYDANGRALGAVTSFSDVTELRRPR